MVGGRFRCLGSVQHLKNRFSEGYLLDIRIQVQQDVSNIVNIIVGSLPGLEVAEQHESYLKFRVPDDLPIHQIFSIVESKKEALGIQDYSLSQTTLEQVFVQFA